MKIRKTTFDQLHGQLDAIESPADGKKLFIDLDICNSEQCEKCVIECSYFYHPVNTGIISLIELATYALICRQCEEPHCVNSCPKDALEKQQDGMLLRHTVRCVSCRTCSHACPYGTIYPEIVPHLANICDYCEGREDYTCVPTCPYGALSVSDKAPEGENVFELGNRLVVHSTHWDRGQA
jgi:Fe-S-cluster-containing hydrogenase component 2